MKAFRSRCFVWFCSWLVWTISARADVSLPALFSDHAVLQKSDRVPIWGKAAPGEAVTVTLDKATASATAGDDGKWKVELNLQAEGRGPFNLIVQGRNRVSVSDVLAGEVWICGGQSNMEFPLARAAHAQEVIAGSANPLLRHFQVKERASATPLDADSIQGKWVAADPKTSGAFTAVGYFFGSQVQKALNVPVGLLNDSWGGTCVEAWTSSEGFDADPELKAEAQKADDDRKAFDDYGVQYTAWQKQTNRQDRPGTDPQLFAAPNVDTSDWKPVTLPGLLSAGGLPDAGAIWIRKTVTIPPEMAGKNLDMRLGDIRDYDKVYWDGRNIGSSDLSAVAHRYGLTSSAHVPAGDHVLAVRIFNPGTGAGIDSDDPRLNVNSIKLDGQWLAKAEFAFPPLDDAARSTLPKRPPIPMDSQNVASYDFNGMIHPIIPYAMRGVIWYQGEANTGRHFR
jgi:sialate O-acetylesterase